MVLGKNRQAKISTAKRLATGKFNPFQESAIQVLNAYRTRNKTAFIITVGNNGSRLDVVSAFQLNRAERIVFQPLKARRIPAMVAEIISLIAHRRHNHFAVGLRRHLRLEAFSRNRALQDAARHGGAVGHRQRPRIHVDVGRDRLRIIETQVGKSGCLRRKVKCGRKSMRG